MALPSSPPKYSSWSELVSPIKEGESGWRAWALQRALVSLGRSITPDGEFGPQTLRHVKDFQENNGLTADGIAGPATQGALVAKISHRVHDQFDGLPDGLLRGLGEAEGVNLLAATNWFTPAGGTPGVDCGIVQWRQYGPPFDQEKLRKAFSVADSFRYASQILLNRIADYNRRRPSLSDSTVLRIALLAHNAPFMAEQVVRNGKLSTPNASATWTVKPGGGHYTHAEWMQVYPDKLMKYATW